MDSRRRMPLFIVTGASGVGKSVICEELFRNESEYIVMESDILWDEYYNSPETNYRKYREMWMRMCCNISQIGMPVILCGCTTPEQFECCDQRKNFSDIHYLAVVSDSEALEKRMRDGRKITDDGWIKSSVDFNNWLKENAQNTKSKITLLDNTKLTVKEGADKAHKWILDRMCT